MPSQSGSNRAAERAKRKRENMCGQVQEHGDINLKLVKRGYEIDFVGNSALKESA